MDDLEIAKNRLRDKDLTLVFVKASEVVFETSERRISGFLEAIEKYGDKLQGASVADRVVGKAIALLCAYVGLKDVYAVILSKGAHEVLERHQIACQWEKLVDNVLDVDRADVCPFEKIALDITDPDEAYHAFEALRQNLNSCRD